MKKFYWNLLFCLAIVNGYGQNTRIHVNASAQGANSGLSWTDAFTDLTNALQTAQPGDSIWVATGTYKPTTGTDHWATFILPNGVHLYGGFAGFENTLTQRNWVSNPTVLSGDTGILNDSSDNSYNVLFLDNPGSNTLIDGFIVRAGNANNTDDFLSSRDRSKCGGAIYIKGQDGLAYADIRNCRFEHNAALNFGGAVFVNGNGSGSVAPRFQDCWFEHNTAGLDGGGLARFGGSWIERTPDYGNCTFIQNRAGRNGGGLYVSDTDRGDTLDLFDCRFYQNLAGVSGGGAYFRPGRISTGSSLKVDSCTFDGNNVASFDGVLALDIYGTTAFVNQISLHNSDFVNHRISMPANSGQGIVRVVGIDNESMPAAWLSSVYNCRFENNSAGSTGHVFYYEHGPDLSASFSAVTFLHNSGANIFFHSNANRAEISRFLFKDNSARLLVNQTNVDTSLFNNSEFSNNLIDNNSNRLFGIKNNYTNLTNVSFINNTRNAPAPYQEPFFNVMAVSNVIFSGNTSLHFLFNTAKTITIEHCYFDSLNCAAVPPGITCGPGILTGIDPLFIDPGSGDYRLQPCSPLINAGNNNAAASSSVDLAGRPRIAQGTVDIGAYESAGPHLAGQPGTSPSCPGGSSGAVLPTVLDACPPLSFTWQSGLATGTTLERLPAGTYTVTATDAKGQTTTFSASILQGAAPALIPASMPVICGDTLGGMALATLQNGKPPLFFHWANGSTDSLRTGLAAGAYPVTVTDANGCSATGIVDVELTGNLSVDIELGAISCHGAADGSFTVLPADGKAPFSWYWEDGSNAPTLAPLGPGTYLGTLTDALGCSIGWILPMGEPGPLAPHPLVTPVSDSTLADGRIELMPTGGTGPFQALWSTGASGLSIDSLAVGFYSVTLTDAHDCTATETIPVGVSSATGEAPGAAPAFSLFPNPATSLVTLILERPAAREGRLQLRAMAGQLLYETTILPGQQSINFQVNDWARGVYLVLVDGRAQKLVLQ